MATLAVTQITGIENENRAGAADWSPDGTEIVYEKFIRNGAGLAHKNLYVMSATGEHQCPLLPDPPPGDTLILRFFPRWSTDGQRILSYEVKWQGEQGTRRFFVQGLRGRKQEIPAIHERLGKNFMIAGAAWMESNRAIVFSIKRMDTPTPNYNLYRYAFETRSLIRLTREASDERWPDWIAGTLSVSPHGKLPTRWGAIKLAFEVLR